MHKLLAIAHREFSAMVATKAFAFTLVMMPILMLGGIVLMPRLGKLGGNKERQIVIADATGSLLEVIQTAATARNDSIRAALQSEEDTSAEGDNPFEAAEFWNFDAAEHARLSDEDRLSLSDQIRDGSLYAFVEIPAETADLSSSEVVQLSFVSQDGALSSARRWLDHLLKQELKERRLAKLGIDPQIVAQANVAVDLDPKMPYTAAEDGSVDSQGSGDSLVSILLPFGIMMLMFLVIAKRNRTEQCSTMRMSK
ncbi:MAG: hypothetical protein MI861_25165 [Pirellulales bacterium]|nr:hypothetical protein [Pirellulales bacterium]